MQNNKNILYQDKFQSCQQGHTLLELVLSLSLGLFILTVSFSFYQSVKKTQKIQKIAVIARENAKFAFDLIKADIQMAGFYGCISQSVNSQIVNTLNTPQDDFRWNFLQSIFASEYSATQQWSPPLDRSLKNSDVYQSDVLTIRYADRQAFSLAKHNTKNAPLITAQKNNLRHHDYGLVSDCTSGSIFQKTNTSTGSLSIAHKVGISSSKYVGNAIDDLGRTYSQTAKVRRLYSISYYIAKKTARIPALYRKDGARRAEEVISGISDMQLSFGIDSNNDGIVDSDLSAAQIQAGKHWQHIGLIKLAITAKAYKEQVLTGDEVALYNDGTEIQYQLQASIALRNNLP